MTRLDLACKIFQRAYEQVDSKDQLIDLMIAFEALFVRKEIAGSPKQKIANGCSNLLGNTEVEKEEIKQLLNQAYSMRSRIVHGAEYKVENIKDYVQNIKNLLRRSIRKILD